MDYVLKMMKKIKINKVDKNRLVMEWVLVKDKFTMQHKTLEMRSSLRNKYKETKINKKFNKIEEIKTSNNKMISKCKETLKVKCMINKKDKRTIKRVSKPSRYQMSKWVKSTTKKDNKISKINKDKLKVKDKQMLTLMDNKEVNKN